MMDLGLGERCGGDPADRRQGGAVTPAGVMGAAVLLLTGTVLAGAALLSPGSGPLQADGGTLRVANVPMGAYRVNIYTEPTPVPPDTIDVSLLVTFERGRGVATGLQIWITARALDGPRETNRATEADPPLLRRQATREQATDPRFYSAKFALGRVGPWEITASVEGPEGSGEVSFRIAVQERGVFQNPLLILALALLPLLLVGWWLKRSGSGQPPPQPPAQG